MARTIEEIVREQVELREEQDRLRQEAEEAEAASSQEPTSQPRANSLLTELDLNSIDADELERWFDRFQEDQNIADAWLAKQATLNVALASLDQQAAKIDELKEDKGQLEVNLDQAKAMNSGLHNENEDLRYKLNME
jgi:hypothetical protein